MCYKHMGTIVLNFLKTAALSLNLNGYFSVCTIIFKHKSFFFKPYYVNLDVQII